MKTDTIIKVLSVILALVIIASAAAPTVAVGVRESKWNAGVLGGLSQWAGILMLFCPTIVLIYLIYVFIFRGEVKGVMLKTLLLIAGAYIAGILAVIITCTLSSKMTFNIMAYWHVFASLALSLVYWAICAAVNTAVREKKRHS